MCQRSLGCWLRLAHHMITHALQTLDQPAFHLVVIRLPEKLLPLLVILLLRLHHLRVDHQNIVPAGQHCSLTSSTFFQTMIAFSQETMRSTNNFAGSFPIDEKMTRAGTRMEQSIRVFLRSKEEISHV